MFTDARIRTALTAMIHGVEAPPVPLLHIQRRVTQPHFSSRPNASRFRIAIATAAAIAVLVLALPSISPAFVQILEARYRAALQALGGNAPPPAPHSLISALTPPRDATLATAQSRVRFTIVPPAGLPTGIVSARIQTIPTGVYSKVTHSWRVGSPAVTFSYRRADGRTFALMADRFDPRAEPPGKYMFEAMNPGRDGRPVLVKHKHFAWRNGNQIMTATEGAGISTAEITAIRAAMRGVTLRERELHAPTSGTSSKLYLLTKP